MNIQQIVNKDSAVDETVTVDISTREMPRINIDEYK
jgi:hypothetical protein